MAQLTTPKLDAKIRLFQDEEGKLLAFADLVIEGSFVITGIKVMMGEAKDDKPGGPFIGFPSRKGTGLHEGKYFDIAHPVTAEAYQEAKRTVLEAYHKARRGAA